MKPQANNKLNDQVRAFVAIELPAELKQSLAALQSQLRTALPKSSVRWSNIAQAHLTLVFLGNIPIAQIAAAKKAIETARLEQSSLLLSTAKPGCFPNCHRPRVLWLGLAGELSELHKLQAALQKHLDPLVPAKDKTSFKPHLTLGRVKSSDKDVLHTISQIMNRLEPPKPLSWPVRSLVLFKSELTPKGAHYSRLHSVELTAKDQSNS